MINYLPEGMRDQIHWGRRNWLETKRLILAALVVSIVATTGVVMARVTGNKQSYLAAQLSQAQTKLDTPQSGEIIRLNNSLALRVQDVSSIESASVDFVRLFRTISEALPKGAVIKNVTLAAVQSSGNEIIVATKSAEASDLTVGALRGIANSPLSSVKVRNSQCDAGSGEYPCTLQLEVGLRTKSEESK